jgi:glycogen synthase
MSRYKKLSKKDQVFGQQVVDLVFEFNHYVIEHPEFTEKIPSPARIILLIEGDEEYNEWAKRLAKRHAKTDNRPLVYLKIKRLRPIRSRIEELELVAA